MFWCNMIDKLFKDEKYGDVVKCVGPYHFVLVDDQSHNICYNKESLSKLKELQV